MKIIVKDNDLRRPIRINLPTALVFNRFTALFAPLALKDSEVTVTRKQALRLIKELKRCKKRFPGWKIVEVESADGEKVEITL